MARKVLSEEEYRRNLQEYLENKANKKANKKAKK